MANGLNPAFVRLFYHTAFGIHTQTIPTLAWSGTYGTNGAGGYLNHLDNEIDAQDMILALVEELNDFMPSTAVYDNAIIYTQATPTSEALPVRNVTLGEAGTGVGADVPASQTTMTLRTEDFGIFKLIWFDATPTTDFLPQRSLPVSGQPLDLFNVVTDPDWAWAGRDGGRPSQFIQVSYTLNEALRRQYRLN
jgi:hypothetical protein